MRGKNFHNLYSLPELFGREGNISRSLTVFSLKVEQLEGFNLAMMTARGAFRDF
jgi:hypothetical protein